MKLGRGNKNFGGQSGLFPVHGPKFFVVQKGQFHGPKIFISRQLRNQKKRQKTGLSNRVSKSGHGPVFCHFWPRPRPLKKIYCTEWARPGPVNRSCTRPVTAIGKRPVLTGLAHSEGHSCPRLGLRVPY